MPMLKLLTLSQGDQIRWHADTYSCAVWTLLTAPYKNTYLLTYLLNSSKSEVSGCRKKHAASRGFLALAW